MEQQKPEDGYSSRPQEGRGEDEFPIRLSFSDEKSIRLNSFTSRSIFFTLFNEPQQYKSKLKFDFESEFDFKFEWKRG